MCGRPGRRYSTHWACKEADRHKPRVVVSNEVVRHLEDTQTMLINRFRHGNMILAGQTLFVLEVEPAGYAALAANEAEKAADINILEVRAVGSFGRVYIGGEETGRGCRSRSGNAGNRGGHRQDRQEDN